MVGVAQLVERCVVVADVAGSSPVTHPNDERPSTRATTGRGPFCTPAAGVRLRLAAGVRLRLAQAEVRNGASTSRQDSSDRSRASATADHIGITPRSALTTRT